MSSSSRPSRRHIKRVIRRTDDGFYDADEDRRITRDDLRDHLADGGFFEVRRQSTGGDCTFEVLQQIVAAEHGDPGSALGLPAVPGLGPAGGMGGAAGGWGGMAEMLSWLANDGEARNEAPRQSRRRLLKPEWGEWESEGGAERRRGQAGSGDWSGWGAGDDDGDGREGA